MKAGKNMKRSFKCNCGGRIEESQTLVEGFLIDAFVCNKCGEVTLSPQSAKQLLKLRAEAEKIDSERKVVRIGNSIGVTLPPEAESIGFREGQLVDVHVIGERQILLKPKAVKN